MAYTKSTVFVTGVSKPNKDDPITSVYNVFFVSAIVDEETDAIVDVTCNAASEMTREFIRSLIVGNNLLDGMEDIVREIRSRFFGLVQKPLIVALKDAHNHYKIVKREKVTA
jgi:hypothetical protein